jgi:hypothetical protein
MPSFFSWRKSFGDKEVEQFGLKMVIETQSFSLLKLLKERR